MDNAFGCGSVNDGDGVSQTTCRHFRILGSKSFFEALNDMLHAGSSRTVTDSAQFTLLCAFDG